MYCETYKCTMPRSVCVDNQLLALISIESLIESPYNLQDLTERELDRFFTCGACEEADIEIKRFKVALRNMLECVSLYIDILEDFGRESDTNI